MSSHDDEEHGRHRHLLDTVNLDSQEDVIGTLERDEEPPRVILKRKHFLLFALFVVSAVAFLYFVLPQLAGLRETWERIKDGNATWLVVACLLEVLSFLGYIALFRAVCIRGTHSEDDPDSARIDWRESYQITMAGLAATRLFAAAGAGGVALTVWALRNSGLKRRIVAHRMLTFMVLLYGIYLVVLVVAGFGLWFGIFPGRAPVGVTLIPAIVGTIILALLLAMALVPDDFQRRLAAARIRGRLGGFLHRAAAVPTLIAASIRSAIRMTRAGDFGLLGGFAWWGFDIATLWASFNAFGDAPPVAVLVMAYFVGMVANFLPLPGGIGAVDGGMIGTLIAFGVPGGLALVAVLVYRGFAFWLPTIPGAIAYVQLRRTVGRWKEREPVVETT